MMRDLVGQGCGPDGNAINKLVTAISEQDIHRSQEPSSSSSSSSSFSSSSSSQPSLNSLAFPHFDHRPDEERILELEQYAENLRLYDEELEKDWGDQQDPFWADSLSGFLPDEVKDMIANAHLNKYEFTPGLVNPYLGTEDPFSTAEELFQTQTLSEAILAYEAAVKAGEQNSDAWRSLGRALAFNDNDIQAIQALKNAVDADPENIEALMDLGISCTNEMCRSDALNALRNWLRIHPVYRTMDQSDLPSNPSPAQLVTHFVKVAESQQPDPDIFLILGVLFTLSSELEKAVSMFRQAIALDPTDYSIWNKLGATLANMKDAEHNKEAIQCYRKALELKPNYVRAWTNLAISYKGLGKHKVSAKYLLHALSLSPNAHHLWNYLAEDLRELNLPNYRELIQKQDLVGFKKFFDF